jgi:hypothetical protein
VRGRCAYCGQEPEELYWYSHGETDKRYLVCLECWKAPVSLVWMDYILSLEKDAPKNRRPKFGAPR